MRRHALLAFVLVTCGAALPALASAAELTVSAAASLSTAFKELASRFEAQNPGLQLRLNFGASDALLAQISHGAPVDVFASADEATMDKAESLQLLQPGTRFNVAGNRLVLIRPSAGVPLAGLEDLAKPEVKRIALGKPEAVPAGRYARSALEATRLWAVVEPKAVYASNVRQALDYVARGEVDAGFVYATDAALQPERLRVVATVPTPLPIHYPIAQLAQAPNAAAARRFLDYLRTAPAQALLGRYGFSTN